MQHAFAEAIGAAVSRAELDDIGRTLWKAVAAGAVSEAEAEVLAERLAARQRGPQAREKAIGRRRPCRSPDRQRSIERRRRLAASGPLPPQLAAKFTTGQLSVLRVIGDEAGPDGTCALPLDAIAARAGVCRTLVRDTIREAARLGLLVRTERRRRGAKSQTNVLRVTSAEWKVWLKIGRKKASATDTRSIKRASPSPAERPQGASERGPAAPLTPDRPPDRRPDGRCA